ncbi:MAG: threonylcarbamoyl-AMP synthase, partial [Burkholderiales bacterium 28-67-8]
MLDGHDPLAIAACADALASGELVAFPTETVYGLGARADDDRAVARIFQAKGRPADHPLIVHLAGVALASRFCDDWPALAQRLTAAFWPGPLTVIVPRAAGVAYASTGGQPTVGLRCPDHPVALALLRAAAARGVPGIAAPSANRFGRLSPTCAAHVVAELGDEPGLRVLDGGDCPVGIESTIIDCSRTHPVLLRPGTLTRRAIEAVLGEPLLARDAAAPHPRSAGLFRWHQTQIGHQLTGRLESGQVADRSDEDDGRDQIDPAYGSQGLHQGGHRPARQHRRDPAFELIA